MKQIIIGVALILLVVGCDKGQQEDTAVQTEAITEPVAPSTQSVDIKAEVKLATATIKAFTSALQTELENAINAGGPAAAINVCNTQAMAITGQVAAEHGMNLGRVSLKNRNPGNAPNKWQTAVLEKFEKKKAAGKDPAKLTWSKIAGKEGKQEFRFMKAIPTGALCLQCHGSDIAPEVSEVLAGLYPDDQATGFGEGDIRGAFVVTRKLPN